MSVMAIPRSMWQSDKHENLQNTGRVSGRHAHDICS